MCNRLQGLEHLANEAVKHRDVQEKLALAFVHNQKRSAGLMDDTVLPDLCSSHHRSTVTELSKPF